MFSRRGVTQQIHKILKNIQQRSCGAIIDKNHFTFNTLTESRKSAGLAAISKKPATMKNNVS